MATPLRAPWTTLSIYIYERKTHIYERTTHIYEIQTQNSAEKNCALAFQLFSCCAKNPVIKDKFPFSRAHSSLNNDKESLLWD